MPAWTRWPTLALASALLSGLLARLAVPGAVLLACLSCAVAFALTCRAPLALPRRAFRYSQGLLGCMMAASLRPESLALLAPAWPLMLAVSVALVVASALLGLWLVHRRVLPGSTALWGLSPGGASAMVLLAEAYGADVRLVAFMQYTRVLIVTLLAGLVAHALAPDAFTANTALPSSAWWNAPTPTGMALTAALVLGGDALAKRLRMSSGALLLPLLGAMLASWFTGMVPALPPALLALAYAGIGWSIGLRFTPAIVRHALGALPAVAMAIMLLIGLGLLLAALLVWLTDTDALTAYLATSPGGIDTMAVIAATSAADTGFVMALQLARFVLVLFSGPTLTRWLAARSP